MLETDMNFKMYFFTDMNNSDIDNRIRFILMRIGVKPNARGFEMIRSAIHKMAINPNMYYGNLTKRLYVDVAKEFDSTWQRVERCMRHSIVNIDYIDDDDCFKYFGRLVQPSTYSNGEFISILATLVRFNIENDK